MKIIKSLFLISGVVFTLTSCGSKEEAKVACPCSEVHISHGVAQKDGMPYTGSCEKLDQHSVATTHADYVNGILVSDYHRVKHGGSYLTYDSLTYESGNPFNGFRSTISQFTFGGVGYIDMIEEFKDGKNIFHSYITTNKSLISEEHSFKYIDMINHENDSEETGTGDLKTSFITYLEKIKKVNPRFEYWVK